MRARKRFHIMAFSALCAACGPDATTTSGGSGGGTAATDATATSGTTGTAGTTRATSAGTAGACEAPPDTYGPQVTVVIRNTQDVPVFLPIPECGFGPQLTLIDGTTGMPVPGLSGCATCEGAFDGSCTCPGAPCFPPTVGRLNPGGQVELVVSATTYVAHDVPPACPGFDLCGDRCDQAQPMPSGTHTLRTWWASDADCGGAPCDCSPDANGWCIYEGTGTAADPMQVDTPFTLPDPGTVEILL